MGLEQVRAQGGSAHLRLCLGDAQVPRPRRVESSLHDLEGLLDLEAQTPEGLVHLSLPIGQRLVLVALVLDEVIEATLGERSSVVSTAIALFGQGGVSFGRQLFELLDLGLVGREYLDVFDIPVFTAHRSVAAIAVICLVALLGPACFGVNTGDHLGAIVIIAGHLNVLTWPGCAGNDRRVGDGAARIPDLESLAL